MPQYADISEELRRRVETEPSSGERITWMAQPLPGRYARMSLPTVVFGIVWTAMALFVAKVKSGFPGNSVLVDVPFILIGCAAMLSPFYMMRKSRRTIYVLTNHRALVCAFGQFRKQVRSFAPERLAELERKQQADGSGDLVFRQDLHIDSEGSRFFKEVGFLGVRNVKQVETMVRDLVHSRNR
jgi:hypothetical protein